MRSPQFLSMLKFSSFWSSHKDHGMFFRNSQYGWFTSYALGWQRGAGRMYASLTDQWEAELMPLRTGMGAGPNHGFLQKRKSKREASMEEKGPPHWRAWEQKPWGSSVSRTSPAALGLGCRTGCKMGAKWECGAPYFKMKHFKMALAEL